MSSRAAITELVEPASLSAIRRLLLLLLVAFMAGTATDLMLLDHHEDPWQMVPLAVMALGVAVAGGARRFRWGRRRHLCGW